MKIAIGFGSNLGEREQAVGAAIEQLAMAIGKLSRRSRLYETEALVLPGENSGDSPVFINSVAIYDTHLEPLEVLASAQRVERNLGRVREAEPRRWQPRLIDLDLLALEDGVFESPELQIPHPEMQHRSFVLEPLAEIWPDWRHPILNLTATEMLLKLS